MQESRFASRLAFALGGALALALASAARADAPADLPLDQVMRLLHDGGFDEAWSITQNHSAKPPWLRTLSVFSDREVLGERLCRSQEADVDLVEKAGFVSLDHPVSKHSVVAFAPCMWAGPKDFHSINGPSDLATLQRLGTDLDTVNRALGGPIPANVKISFKDVESRKLFAPDVSEADLLDIYSNENGHSRFCFITKGRDIIGAPETMGVEVIPGKVTELKVDICGVIDIQRSEESK